MICIRCQQDSTYPERKDTKKCAKCGGRFAFEPRENDPFTDVAFQKAIDTVSSSGQVKWGVEHLYYELCRKKQGSSGRGVIIFIILVLGSVLGIFIADAAPGMLLLFVPLVLGLIYLAYQGLKPSLLDRGKFEQMWDRWGQVHGKPKSVIARRPQEARPARAQEPDLGDYSFDRAVICDRARTVDLLLANNFHFENNCAVLSVGGYPQQAFETVRRMLLRNPRLEVFVLHDITPEGCGLAYRLANDPEWFRGTRVRIVDVGLRPVHAGPFQKLLLKSHRSVQSGQGIKALEAEWLSQHSLELAVIRPEQVVKRLFRAMNKTNTAARAPEARLEDRGPQTRPLRGAVGAGTTAAVGAAVLAPTAAMAAHQDAEELARQKKKAAAQGGGDSGSSSSSSDSGFEIDTDSFSSDADASDGGADSFG